MTIANMRAQKNSTTGEERAAKIEAKFQEALAEARGASENPEAFEAQLRDIPAYAVEMYRVETYFNMIHATLEEHEKLFLNVLRLIEFNR